MRASCAGTEKGALRAAALANSSADATLRVLYASGEETVSQIANKAYRLLGSRPASDAEEDLVLPQNLDVVCETSVERLEDLLAGSDYAIAMIDSVQTCITDGSVGAAGSVATLRAVADRMMNLAKTNEITLVLAGHVTKDGQIAGPRLLEPESLHRCLPGRVRPKSGAGAATARSRPAGRDEQDSGRAAGRLRADWRHEFIPLSDRRGPRGGG